MDVSAIAAGGASGIATPSEAAVSHVAVESVSSNARPTHDPGLAPAISKLFGSGAPTPITLNVSYRVVKELNEIVTVFSDPKTGEEIAQFPPEILIGLAEFFDHTSGATLDKSA